MGLCYLCLGTKVPNFKLPPKGKVGRYLCSQGPEWHLFWLPGLKYRKVHMEALEGDTLLAINWHCANLSMV